MVARCRRGGAGGSARPASMGPEPRSFLRIEFEPAPGQEALFGGRRAAAVARAEQRFLRHRSEEHTSELQSLMRISYAVFCLKKKKTTIITVHTDKRINHRQCE